MNESTFRPSGATDAPLLTVVIPVYNEERTVAELLRRVAAGPYPHPQKEVVVVDDGSSDRTAEILRDWSRPGFRILRHAANRGKGAAVRTGFAAARGEIVIVQDADLEYDPSDYPKVVEPIRRGEAEVVYGSRYLAANPDARWDKFRVAVELLNRLVWVLYGQRLTDEATCYKAMRADLLRRLDLKSERFELCAEMTAKVCRLGVPIREVAIGYRPRGVDEGKKIGWRDAWTTFATLFRWRWARMPARKPAPARRPAATLAAPPAGVTTPAGLPAAPARSASVLAPL
jgi:dolichol-phosphate mannosyltransferase